MRRRSPIAAVAALVTAGLLAGCVSMPDSGPVVETQSDGGVSVDQGTYINPKPPQAGDTRADIVRGFLVAMTATPIQTNTAREFLTEDAASAWTPEDQTITYVGYPRVAETAASVSVTLTDPDRLDAQGAWQGPLPKTEHTIGFPMSFEDGEWRIDQAPNALIVPESWFARRFRQVSLYFFDPTAGILAPEPVYVAGGKQLASTLTQALLLGPGQGLNRVVKSFLPPGLTVYLSVPISKDGIADIGLKGDGGQLTTRSIELMMAQLAWTLRQDPRIRALRVSINGEPVPLPGGVSAYRVDGGAEFDPAGFQASPLLYGLRDGLLSSGTSGTLPPVSGPLGTTDLGLRSIGVSLTASEAAGVTKDGRSVVVGPVSGADGTATRTVVTERARPAASRVGLRRPDVAGGPHHRRSRGLLGQRRHAAPAPRPRHLRHPGAQLRDLPRRDPPGRRRTPARGGRAARQPDRPQPQRSSAVGDAGPPHLGGTRQRSPGALGRLAQHHEPGHPQSLRRHRLGGPAANRLDRRFAGLRRQLDDGRGRPARTGRVARLGRTALRVQPQGHGQPVRGRPPRRAARGRTPSG